MLLLRKRRRRRREKKPKLRQLLVFKPKWKPRKVKEREKAKGNRVIYPASYWIAIMCDDLIRFTLDRDYM